MHSMGLKNSLLNTTTFRLFHVLHNRKLSFCTSILNLFISSKELVQSWLNLHCSCAGNHWCCTTSFQTRWVSWQVQNRWSMDSISIWKSGHSGSIWHPRRNKITLTGSALWQTCHKKILILGIVLIDHIHLYGHGWRWTISLPSASQVADLVVNSPEPFRPQQKESPVSITGNAMLKICWRTRWFCTVSLNFSKFHCLLHINSLTLTFGSRFDASSISKSWIKFCSPI